MPTLRLQICLVAFFLIPTLIVRGEEPVHFANSIKIGELTDTSVVLWTRLTATEVPKRQIPWDQWDQKGVRPWSLPGVEGRVRFRLKDGGETLLGAWHEANADNNYCVQQRLDGLEAATEYTVFADVERAGSRDSFQLGSFTSAPSPTSEVPVNFIVSTCQEFETRDDGNRGHKIYRSMLEENPDFFIQAGDTIYYDRKQPLSKTVDLARYRWNRMYALPNMRRFHATVPTYWLKDDHDLLKNDAWPGATYGQLTWNDGLALWHENIPQAEKPYRTYRWGRNLQIWLPEGREFRSPNKMPDGPDKSILGAEQWEWLETTLAASTARFKLVISATPVVGPDRKNKADNHANSAFAYEGEKLRKLLSDTPGCFVINGDRHWQYHSIDSETGLNEYSAGPSTDKHAGGWSDKNGLTGGQQFLRVAGGFLSIRVDADQLTLQHHDVDGNVVYTSHIPAPASR